MTRATWKRDIASIIAAGLCAAALAALVSSCVGAPARERARDELTTLSIVSGPPNIIMLLLDDASMSQMTTKFPQTKTRFTTLGINTAVFDRMYCSTPICAPARAQLLTGNYAHQTGVHHNVDWSGGLGGAHAFEDSGADQDTIATRLQTAGYDTALVGKYLNGYDWQAAHAGPPGWDYVRTFFNTANGYYNYSLVFQNGSIQQRGSTEADYSTDVFKARALTVVEDSGEAPFFLWFAPFAPHDPNIYHSRHASLYPTQNAPRPINYDNEDDKIGKPDWVQLLDWTTQQESEIDPIWRDKARTMAAVDEAIVAIVDAVDAKGKLDNTIFVLVSDNGYCYGEHMWLGKMAPYEPSVLTPCIIAGKSALVTTAVRSQLVGNIDLTATLLDAAGVSYEGMDGVSFLSLLTSSGSDPRADFLLERRSPSADGGPIPEKPLPSWKGLIARREGKLWKYVELAVGDVNAELYDLDNDPHELVNLIEDSSKLSLIAELALRLDEVNGD